MRKIALLFTILFVLIVNVQAELDIYGKINMGVWYTTPNRYYQKIDTILTITDTLGNVTYDSIIGTYKDSLDIVVTNWVPFGTLGLKYHLDKFAGCIEMGTHRNLYDQRLFGSPTTARLQRKISDYVTMNKWYGEWVINDNFTFLFGKDFTPTNFSPSNQMFFGGEYRFGNVGCLSTGTSPMFQIKAKSINDAIEGKFAIIRVDTTAITIQAREEAGDTAGDFYKCSVKAPKFEGGFKYSIEKGIFSTYGNFAGGYQFYQSVLFSGTNAVPKKDSCYLDVESFIVGVDLGIKVDPVSFSIDALYGKNIGVYGAFVGDRFSWWKYALLAEDGTEEIINDYMEAFYPVQAPNYKYNDTTGINEIKSWSYYQSKATAVAFILALKPFEWLVIEGGYGMVFVDHGLDKFKEEFKTTTAWYFQTEIRIHKLLKVTPEVGSYNFGEMLGYGKYMYWGINTGIDF